MPLLYETVMWFLENFWAVNIASQTIGGRDKSCQIDIIAKLE